MGGLDNLWSSRKEIHRSSIEFSPQAQFPLIFLINSPNINDWSEPDLTINGKTFVCGTLVKSVEDIKDIEDT